MLLYLYFLELLKYLNISKDCKIFQLGLFNDYFNPLWNLEPDFSSDEHLCHQHFLYFTSLLSLNEMKAEPGCLGMYILMNLLSFATVFLSFTPLSTLKTFDNFLGEKIFHFSFVTYLILMRSNTLMTIGCIF
jgi:hypothetical protein